MSAPGWWGAGIALLLAFVLSALPLPEVMAVARPALVPLVLVYLCLHAPHRFGIASAWLLGLLLDVSHASLLGQHALAMSLLAYGVLKLRDTLKLIPAWQQMFVLLPLWAGYQGLLLWLDGYAGQPIEAAWRWIPVASTTLSWLPLVALFALLGSAGSEGGGRRRPSTL